MKSPLYDGPIARLLGGADLSWLLGFPLSAVLYIALAKAADRRLAMRTPATLPQLP
jgi:hypothetical protein